MKKDFLENLFDFFDDSDIPYAIMRSYESLPDEVRSGDIDIVIDKKNVIRIVEYLQSTTHKITAVGMHVGVFGWCVDVVVCSVVCLCEKCLTSGCWRQAAPAGC